MTTAVVSSDTTAEPLVRRPAPGGCLAQADARVGFMQDILMAVSLANLSLCFTWHRLFSPRQMLMSDWSRADLIALSINLLGLTAAFLAGIRISRKFPIRGLCVHNLLILYPLFLMLDLLRQTVPSVAHALSSTRNVVIGAVVVLLISTWLLLNWLRSAVPGIEFVLAFMVFLLPLFFVRAVMVVLHSPPPPQIAGFLPHYKSTPRVVWIIFDEMDPRFAFDHRPRGLAMPEFDRLKSEATYMNDMTQAEHDTDVAMPSLVYGEHVSEISFDSRWQLLGTIEGSSHREDLRRLPDIFGEARQAGFNTGVVGWFLPYCRIFADELSRCYTESMYGNSQSTVGARMKSQLFGLTPWQSHLQHVERYHTLLQQAKDMASDPRLGLVLLHLAVPHGPGIYDPRRGQLTKFGIDDSDWYSENLALTDRTLGQIRHAMEQAGIWDSSILLVSSDHKLRTVAPQHSEGRVPYLVKLKGQQSGWTCDLPLNARITRSLINAILDGRLATTSDLYSWLSSGQSGAQAAVGKLNLNY